MSANHHLRYKFIPQDLQEVENVDWELPYVPTIHNYWKMSHTSMVSNCTSLSTATLMCRINATGITGVEDVGILL